MRDVDGYIEAAMIQCPRCDASVGAKCWTWKCKNGRKGCTFAICAYKGALPEPHLERAVAARKAQLRAGSADTVQVDTRDEATVEKVARAIWGASGHNPDDWAYMAPETERPQRYKHYARAALDALETP